MQSNTYYNFETYDAAALYFNMLSRVHPKRVRILPLIGHERWNYRVYWW